ncbi:hypothetical protein ACFVYP_33955 [Kitasatospora sp. NPDC058201]|uniref:hypothetical protein n=1 Tax=unclassified Kitasatospora TaxID=2633591 RepID=UPI00364B3A52
MLTWLVRILSALSYAAMATVVLWTAGLPGGVALPVGGLTTAAWIAFGLLWLRVAALWLWWSDDNHGWLSRAATRRRSVSLVKDAPRRRFSSRFSSREPFDFDSKGWVYSRQVAVWLLLPVACAALAGFAQAYESETVRSVVRAGASVSTATVIQADDISENFSDGDVVGYFSKLTLALPGGGTVRAEGAYTPEEPEPDTKVEVLWAPSAPELGGRVHYATDMSRYLDHDWGLTSADAPALALAVVLVLSFVVTIGFATEEDGLQDLAWRPVAQTVHAVVVGGVLLASLPSLAGTADPAHATDLLFASGIAVLLLYTGMHLRPMLD